MMRERRVRDESLSIVSNSRSEHTLNLPSTNRFRMNTKWRSLAKAQFYCIPSNFADCLPENNFRFPRRPLSKGNGLSADFIAIVPRRKQKFQVECPRIGSNLHLMGNARPKHLHARLHINIETVQKSRENECKTATQNSPEKTRLALNSIGNDNIKPVMQLCAHIRQRLRRILQISINHGNRLEVCIIESFKYRVCFSAIAFFEMKKNRIRL